MIGCSSSAGNLITSLPVCSVDAGDAGDDGEDEAEEDICVVSSSSSTPGSEKAVANREENSL